MAILQLIGIVSVVLFLRTLISDRIILISAILGTFVWLVFNLVPSNPDPILQYYPLRFLFPALSLLLVMWLQAGMSLEKILLCGIFCGAAIFWNLESGLAVSVAMTAFVFLSGVEPVTKQMSRILLNRLVRLLTFLSGVALFLVFFAVYLSMKAGQIPDFENFLIYQTTFYLTGYGMLPLPGFPDMWSLYLLLLLFSLVYVSIALAKPCETRSEFERVGYLLVMAVGLLLYCSGRSHLLVLKLVSWPACLLYFFMADRAVRQLAAEMGEISFRKTAVAFSIRAIGLAAGLGFFAQAIMLSSPVWSQAKFSGGSLTDVQRDAAFIASKSDRGERVGILAFHQTTLHVQSDTVPGLTGPSVAEILRHDDLENIYDQLQEAGPDKLFINTQLDSAADKKMLGANIRLDMRVVGDKYLLVEVSPEGRIAYFKRRS